jgi:Arc/MetJ-type ribon-helix-helix transcriptional regulator
MVRTQVQLTEKQMAMVRQIAAQRNISMSEVIRQGLDYYLHHSIAIDRNERVRRALEVTGKFRSGFTDVSEHHDEHLAESYSQ